MMVSEGGHCVLYTAIGLTEAGHVGWLREQDRILYYQQHKEH